MQIKTGVEALDRSEFAEIDDKDLEGYLEELAAADRRTR